MAPRPTGTAPRSMRRRVGRVSWSQHRERLLGLVILLGLITFAVFMPLLTRIDPNAVHPEHRLAMAGSNSLMGTDQFGRDVAARLAAGIKLSFLVASASVATAFVVGTSFGLVAGYVGGWADELLMRGMDVLLAFPYVVLAIALAAAIGAGLVNVIVIIAVLRMPHFSRVARAAVLGIKQLEYVVAAKAVGQSPTAIVLRHILPNSLSSLIVMMALSSANAVTAEAALSFLGLGINPPAASLGNMLHDAQQYVLIVPGLALWPGLAISLLVLGLNLLGDSIQESLDPRLRPR